MSELVTYVARPVEVRAKRLAQPFTANNGRGGLVKGSIGEFVVIRSDGRTEILTPKQFDSEFWTPEAAAADETRKRNEADLDVIRSVEVKSVPTPVEVKVDQLVTTVAAPGGPTVVAKASKKRP